MSEHRLRVEGNPGLLFAILGSATIQAGKVYQPVEGVTVRLETQPRALNYKAFPPPDVVFDFVVQVGGPSAAGLLATHLMKHVGGRVKRMWLDRRAVESEEDIMDILREAQGLDEEGGGSGGS